MNSSNNFRRAARSSCWRKARRNLWSGKLKLIHGKMIFVTDRLINQTTMFYSSEIRGGNPAPQIEWLLDGKQLAKEVSSKLNLSRPFDLTTRDYSVQSLDRWGIVITVICDLLLLFVIVCVVATCNPRGKDRQCEIREHETTSCVSNFDFRPLDCMLLLSWAISKTKKEDNANDWLRRD